MLSTSAAESMAHDGDITSVAEVILIFSSPGSHICSFSLLQQVFVRMLPRI
jgi:hypothetical protein